MTESDMKWLKDLNERSWEYHPPQYSGGRQTSYGHSEDKPISEFDREKFWNLIEFYKKQLVFDPGSGVFGFGVSMAVYIPKPGTYPGVPDEAELLICVTSKQMFNSNQSNVGEAYKAFGKYTHTERNKAARQEAGLKEPLHDWSYYDY
jgi:hypothetical protein